MVGESRVALYGAVSSASETLHLFDAVHPRLHRALASSNLAYLDCSLSNINLVISWQLSWKKENCALNHRVGWGFRKRMNGCIIWRSLLTAWRTSPRPRISSAAAIEVVPVRGRPAPMMRVILRWPMEAIVNSWRSLDWRGTWRGGTSWTFGRVSIFHSCRNHSITVHLPTWWRVERQIVHSDAQRCK